MHREIQGYGWSGDPSKYDKYVKAKEVHFPFDVQINGVYHETTSDTNSPDYWIDLDSYDKTTFYIPTWSIEGEEYHVLYRVTSINTEDEHGTNHIGDTQDVANTNMTKYVATYDIPVQLSGRIYGFQAVGINDKMMFQGEEKGIGDMWYAFCPEKEEKKSGTKNRLGGNSVRYTVDGTLTNNWDIKNTLPFCNGTSWAYNEMGTFWKGHRFAFSLKTIANLWDEDMDSIEITPTFRYISEDGTQTTNDVDVYYTIGDNLFVKYGEDRDTNLKQKISLSGEAGEFRGSYYEDDLNYTVEKHLS